MKLLLDENLSRRLVPFLQLDNKQQIEDSFLFHGMACIEVS
jgi:predicted nuclease of predicted toxin-antitoxin system